jgi:hypothetical protein
MFHTPVKKPETSTWIPRSLGICFSVMISASANTKPSRTDVEKNWAMRPSRSSPASTEISPANSASAAVSATYLAVPGWARDVIVAADVMATADDTATTSWRELPSTAYISRPIGAA